MKTMLQQADDHVRVVVSDVDPNLVPHMAGFEFTPIEDRFERLEGKHSARSSLATAVGRDASPGLQDRASLMEEFLMPTVKRGPRTRQCSRPASQAADCQIRHTDS